MEDIFELASLNTYIAKNVVVLIEFHAIWCNQSRIIDPTVRQLVVANHVALARVDIDQAFELAQKYGIKATPTFAVVTANGVALMKTGGNEAIIKECIEKAKTLK